MGVFFFFFEKIGSAMALPLGGIQGQSNIKTCLEPRQKSASWLGNAYVGWHKQ